MLQIGKALEPVEFSRRVVPPLSRLFTSTDRAIRRSLLESIDTYGAHLDQVIHNHTYINDIHAGKTPRDEAQGSSSKVLLEDLLGLFHCCLFAPKTKAAENRRHEPHFLGQGHVKNGDEIG